MAISKSRRGRTTLTFNGDIVALPRPSAQQWLEAIKLGKDSFNEIIRQRRVIHKEDSYHDKNTLRRYAQWKEPFSAETGYVYSAAAPNFAGMDLRGMDLHGYDLRCAYFGRARLTGTDLRGACLDYANFEKATLREADLEGTRLFKVQLSDVQMQGANLDGCVIDSCEITSGASGYGGWVNVHLDGAHFKACTISGWYATVNAPVKGITFTHCRMRHDTVYDADDKGRVIEVRLRGDINRMVLDRCRVHSLILDAKDCDLISLQSVYLWITARCPGSIIIDSESLRDHGGRIVCVSIPSRVKASRWEAMRVETDAGNGLVLECMPRRVQLEYDRPTPLEGCLRSYVADWERGRSRAFEVAARKRGAGLW